MYLDLDVMKPINFLKFTSDGDFENDNKDIEELFSLSDIRQREIVAFSIVGTCRKGKSFFLNYCLRYLYANVI